MFGGESIEASEELIEKTNQFLSCALSGKGSETADIGKQNTGIKKS